MNGEARLGPAEYEVLLHLMDGAGRRLRTEDARAVLDDDASFRYELLRYLDNENLVSIATRLSAPGGTVGEWTQSIEITQSGRNAVADVLAMRWYFSNSEMSENTPSYWFEAKDLVTGRHFVVSVADFVGWSRARELANETAADAEVRHEARQLTETGREHEITARHDADAVPIVTVWRKT